MSAPTVLVVDDHPDSRTIYEIVLKQQGWDVVTAPDGWSGLRLARSRMPAAVVLDVALPGLDGWTVAELLREEPGTAAIPIIFCTANWLDSDLERGTRLGCAAYLVKPCSPQAIVDAVRRCIERTALTATPAPGAGAGWI